MVRQSGDALSGRSRARIEGSRAPEDRKSSDIETDDPPHR